MILIWMCHVFPIGTLDDTPLKCAWIYSQENWKLLDFEQGNNGTELYVERLFYFYLFFNNFIGV